MNTHLIGTETIDETILNEVGSLAPWLSSSFRELIRGNPDDYSAYFHNHSYQASVSATQTQLRFHVIAADGNGDPRVSGLAQKLRNQLLDYALPRKQVAEAFAFYQKTKSSEKLVSLEAKAKGLFADVAKSGEGGEILLYYLAERVLKFPQVLCKMALKTSTQKHYHGVDGVHASVDETSGRLALYWGESKLHKDVASGVRECFESIAPFLLEREGSGTTPERDLQLLRDNIDLNDPKLEQAFKRFLDPEDAFFLKTEFRAICLVGFTHEKYAQMIGGMQNPLTADVKAVFDGCATKIQTAIQSNKIEKFVIEIFCVPFPCVEAFRNAFQNELGHKNGTQ